MKNINQLFLQALKAALENNQVSWEMDIPPQDWVALFKLADTHHVLPMIYEAVYNCPAAKKMDQQLFVPFKKKTFQMVMLQTMKTSEFLTLYTTLDKAGLKPLIVKGIICRNLYPKPDYRMSGDEDILIQPEQFHDCHENMLNYGMQLSTPGQDIENAYEVPYGKAGSPIYIELHKSLFPPESEAYGDLNRFFEGVAGRAIGVEIDGNSIRTMEYTDHLFYLICHSFKHFLHSGFGIRQVCDIVLFANKYGNQIDWTRILKQCREIHADLFTAALFQIGQKYLIFDPDKACYPEEWRNIQVDETLMLSELLESGVFGDSSMSRKHSSNITLNAVTAQRTGKKAGNGILKTLFPSAKQLEGRYPYLKKKPYLLPIVWIERIVKYRKETQNSSGNNATESIQIGNQRIELMRKYGILEKKVLK